MNFKYNESRVVIPDGWDRNALKHKLTKASRLGQRERHVLQVVLDQAPSFVLTRGWIRAATGLTERTWTPVMKNLVAAKLLYASSARTPEKYTIWRLLFDLGPLAEGVFENRKRDTDDPDIEDAGAVRSYPQRSQDRGDHARARDPSISGDSRDTHIAEDLRDPHVLQCSRESTFSAATKPKTFLNQKETCKEPPPREARWGGGGDFENLREAASADQQRILDALLANPPPSIKHPAAWRQALARRAAAGRLTEPVASANASHQDPTRDKAMVGWWANDPAFGVLQVTHDLRFDSIKLGVATRLTEDDSCVIWRRQNRKELTFFPPPVVAV